jgi:trimeric autotransporter adhesin
MLIGKRWLLTGALLATTVLSGCGGDSGSAKSELRVIHAAGNAPAVNVNANGAPLSAVQGLDYGTATSRLLLPESVYSVSVDGVLPGDQLTEVVAPVDLALNRGELTTVVAIGNIAAEGDAAFGPEVIVTAKTNVASGETRVQVVHASAAAQTALPDGVSVYVTAPGADLAEQTPLVTFGLREYTDAITVPAGSYQIRVTPSDSTTPVFDSGEISLPGGADLMVLAIDSHGPGSPVKLLVSTGNQEADFTLTDIGAPTDLRVVHAASGVGAAEVFASADSIALATTEVIDSFAYRTDQVLADLTPAVDYAFAVNADGGGAVTAPISVSDVRLAPAAAYTALAVGNLPAMGTPDLGLLLLQDDRRSVATEVKVRAVHAASLAGTVAVFIAPAGEQTLASIELGEVMPTLPAFEYQSDTGYLSLTPGNYDVRVAVADDSGGYTVAIDLADAALGAGDIVTLVATNPELEGEEFAFVILND